jgi:hypothetical protein
MAIASTLEHLKLFIVLNKIFLCNLIWICHFRLHNVFTINLVTN